MFNFVNISTNPVLSVYTVLELSGISADLLPVCAAESCTHKDRAAEDAFQQKNERLMVHSSDTSKKKNFKRNKILMNISVYFLEIVWWVWKLADVTELKSRGFDLRTVGVRAPT